jgi:hypothetical protein
MGISRGESRFVWIMGRRKQINTWLKFANETGGRFIEGIAWHGDKAIIQYKNCEIEFDCYTLWSDRYHRTMTRVRVPIISLDDFRFEIYNATAVRVIEKFFGAMDTKVGHSDFDERFIVKSNETSKIILFLQNEKIRRFILSLKDVNILITDRKGIWGEILPGGQLELAYYASGEINDIDVLKSLLELFEAMLDGLLEKGNVDG